MPFRAQLNECHVLNPYPELNSWDTFWATTQGTPASRPLRYQRSLVDQAHHGKRNAHILQHHRLAQTMRHRAHRTSRPPGGGHKSPNAPRLWFPLFAGVAWRDAPCRKATRVLVLLYWLTFAWRVTYCRQAPHQYSHSTGFSSTSGLYSIPLFTYLLHQSSPYVLAQ